MKEPEFNNGFLTALVLFYGHIHHGDYSEIDIRMYGATDHLLNLQIPLDLDMDLQARVHAFVKNTVALRYADRNCDDVFVTCKSLIQDIVSRYQPQIESIMNIVPCDEEGVINGKGRVDTKIVNVCKQIDKEVFGLPDVVVNYQ